MNKVVVLLSGGIDSLVCLGLAIKKYGTKNVKTLSIDYGQNNRKELIMSKKIADYYNVDYEIIDISSIFKKSNCALIECSKNKIPHESYLVQYKKLKENEDVITNVPFRNGTMLSICCTYCIINNINLIYYGIHKEEGIASDLYPDCSYMFNESMNLAIYIGSGKKVKIESPLVDMSKKEIIKLGKKLNIPFELTWTCYENKKLPCGKCTACTDRISAFNDNGIIDPLKYEV